MYVDFIQSTDLVLKLKENTIAVFTKDYSFRNSRKFCLGESFADHSDDFIILYMIFEQTCNFRDQITLIRTLMGLWIFHRLMGGGGVETPPF